MFLYSVYGLTSSDNSFLLDFFLYTIMNITKNNRNSSKYNVYDGD